MYTNIIYCIEYIVSCVQASMDLPPDKAKLLKQYDNEKKWDIICDQVSILYFIQNNLFFYWRACVYVLKYILAQIYTHNRHKIRINLRNIVNL